MYMVEMNESLEETCNLDGHNLPLVSLKGQFIGLHNSISFPNSSLKTEVPMSPIAKGTDDGPGDKVNKDFMFYKCINPSCG